MADSSSLEMNDWRKKRFQYLFPQSTNFLVPRLLPANKESQVWRAVGLIPRKVLRKRTNFLRIHGQFPQQIPIQIFSRVRIENLQQIVSSSWLDLRQYDNKAIYFMQTNTITLRALNVILLFFAIRKLWKLCCRQFRWWLRFPQKVGMNMKRFFPQWRREIITLQELDVMLARFLIIFWIQSRKGGKCW